MSYLGAFNYLQAYLENLDLLHSHNFFPIHSILKDHIVNCIPVLDFPKFLKRYALIPHQNPLTMEC